MERSLWVTFLSAVTGAFLATVSIATEAVSFVDLDVDVDVDFKSGFATAMVLS